MKKRILSLLLLLAMLLTMIPVVASAEEAAAVGESNNEPSNTASSELTAEDVIAMYAASDHLTSFFTTFLDGQVDLTAGTWTDLVGGGTASFVTPGRWSVNGNGGVGFDVFYGAYTADGEAATTAEGKYNVVSTVSQTNSGTTGVKLNFGISKLPTEDFTVEYLAMYKPVYMADYEKYLEDGTITYAYDANGARVESYNVLGDFGGGSPDSGAFDRIGFLSSYSTQIDGSYQSGGRDAVYWLINAPKWGGNNGNWLGGNAWGSDGGLNIKNSPFKQNDVVNTYGIFLDETYIEDTEVTEAHIGLYRNALFYKDNASYINSTAGSGALGYNAGEFGDNQFYLSSTKPTDFYTVRIYDKVLTEAEKQQNRAVDVILYYGIELSAEDVADPVKMQAIYSLVNTYTIETDESEKAATAAELASAIEGVTVTSAENTLYVQKGLTSLFTAFAGENSANATGQSTLWINRVAGKASATFVGGAWSVGALGGIGRDVIYGTLNTAEDGTYSFAAHNDRNTYWATNNHKLQLGLELLPKDDYTVEYLAFYPPQYSVNAKTGELIATDEAAVLTNGDTTTNTYYPYQVTWVDRFGFLAFITDNPHGRIETQPIGALRPRAEDSGCTAWAQKNEAGVYAYSWGNMDFTMDNRNLKRVATYALTRDEDTTLNDEGVATLQTALYSQILDGTVLGSKSYTTKNGCVAEGGSNTSTQYFFGDDNTDFYLSYRIGAHYYALRIYDRVLSAAEQAQNNAADVYYYYGLTLSDEAFADETAKTMMFSILAGQSFERDASAYAAKKAELQAELNNIDALISAANDLTQMYAAPENLVALFSVYAPESLSVAGGTWANLVGTGTATLESPARWSLNADGSVGYTAWVGSIADDGTTKNVIAGNDTAHLGFNGLNHGHQRLAKLSLGLALLPEGDMTVEFMAMSKNVYVADAEESSASEVVYAKDENGDYYTAYDLFGAQYFNCMDYGTPSGGAIDQVGYYGTFSPVTDGAYWGGGRGAVHWTLETTWNSDRSWVNNVGVGGYTNNTGLNINGNPFWTANVIRTYGIYIDETVTEDATEAVLGMYRNAAHYNSNADKVSTTADGSYYAGGYTANASKAGFYLCSARPTDFYGVRVYNKVLTVEEQARNHLTDLVLYYDLTIPAEILADDDLMQDLATYSATVPFATDAMEKAAASLQLADIINTVLTSSKVYELYVSDGIVSHFGALSASDGTANVAEGVWTNRVTGGKAATMGNKQYWRKNANGSVGYDVFYGSVDAEGNYSDTSAYNNYSANGLRLDLGIDTLPKDDFTVEFVAQVNPVYVADADGNPAGETYLIKGSTPGSQQYGAAAYGAVYQMGYFAGYTTNRDGVHGGFTARGGIIWTTSATAWSWGDSTQISSWNNNSDPFAHNGEVNTYVVTRDEYDETLEDESTNRVAVYTLLRNAEKYADRKIDAAEKAWAVSKSEAYKPADYATDDTGYFYLGERISIDYYAVRVYNRVLTTEEQAQNHFADIVLYYGLSLDEKVYDENSKALENSVRALRSAVIVTDASEKAANRALYQSLLDEAVIASEIKAGGDYASLYVQNDLVGLYTAFAEDNTLDTINGVWKNQAAEGGDATLKGSTFWTPGMIGFGYSMNHLRFNTYAKQVGIVLPNEFAEYDNFTVETFAMVEGLTDENGNRYVNDWKNAEKDENGKAVHPELVRQYGWYVSYQSTFRFDMLTSLFFTSLDANTPGQSMASRWYFMNQAYQNSIPDLDPGEDNKYEAILLVDGDAGWRPMAADSYLPKAMKVTKTTALDGAETYDVAYDLVSKANMTITAAQRADLEAGSAAEADRFTLFNALPSTVYAIRVYNRALTAAEALQNSFVDKLAYFNINIEGFENLTADQKTALYTRFQSVSYDADVAKVQAVFDFYAKNDAENMAKSIVTFENYAPILANAYGYRVIFSMNNDAVKVFDEAGYTVTYGALVAAGGTANVTVGASGVKNIIVGGKGANGTIFDELAGAKGYYFSVAVTAADIADAGKDAIVRGYVTVTDPKGVSTTYYDDVYENDTLDGELSVLDAADYFVNRYDGDVATQYKYMNAAVLRELLANYGYATRVALEDDLVLYVDVDGNDGNNGLSADTAYATLDAAFAAAKAHLGKPGRKTVHIELAAGKYHLTETLMLSAEDILADEYAFTMAGQGDETILTSEVAISTDGMDYDEDGNLVLQLPADEEGNYPHFRAVYADGELLNIAHMGSSEETAGVSAFRIVDALGNKLTTTGNDWTLSDADKAKAKYAVFTFPAALLSGDLEAYVGAELHLSIQWTAHIMHVADVKAVGDNVDVYVVYNELPGLNSGHSFVDGACWIENAKVLMTGDTYYYDEANGKLYFLEENIWPSEGAVLTYASLANLITFKDVENVTVRDMAFTGFDSKYLKPNAGVACGQAQGTTTIRYTDGTANEVINFMDEAAIYAIDADGLTVKNVAIYDALGSGVVAKGIAKNVVIDSSRFENLGAKAIHLGTASSSTGYVKNLKITNNYVNNIGTLYPAAVAVQATHVANAEVIGNTVTHVPYSAFSFGWIWSTVGSTADAIVQGAGYATFNMEIAYNYVSDFMMALCDGGAFYLLGGNVVRSANDTTPYNFMHHNYINLSHETGRSNGNDAGLRFAMGYYHDNSSSNWLDYNNVMINTAKTVTGNENTYMYAFYLQDIKDCEAQNVNLVDNYFIGFSRASHLYIRNTVVNEAFGITSSDYVYENAAKLKANTSIDLGTWGNAEFKTSPANASTTVAAIFAASGSTLAPAQESGLTWTAAAAQRELLGTFGADADSFGKAEYTLTITDGVDTVTSKVYAGTEIDMPYMFAKHGYVYTYKVNGNPIDLAEYKMPAANVTINVTATVLTYTVTLKDGTTTKEIEVPVGGTFELPAEYTREGYDARITWDGDAVDLSTFAMPEHDIEMRVGYTLAKHRVTFSDGVITKNYTGEYGTSVPSATVSAFTKTGHTAAYYIGGVKISFDAIKVGSSDITVEVRYEPKTYNVTFLVQLGEEAATTHATVKVAYGSAITLPEAPASFEAEGYLYTFAGWDGYEEGMILETEGTSFTALWDVDEIKDEPELALGDIDGNGVVDITDIVAVINIASGAVNEYPGNPDVDGSGVVDITDIVTVINIASGSAS